MACLFRVILAVTLNKQAQGLLLLYYWLTWREFHYFCHFKGSNSQDK